MPAATPLALDATAEHCDHPCLLTTRLPGRVGSTRRIWTAALTCWRPSWSGSTRSTPRSVPGRTRRGRRRSTCAPRRVRCGNGVDVLRRDPPPYEGRFLHRDFRPGNVLFTGAGEELRVSGVVDWVETSWGPADLDVALPHCLEGAGGHRQDDERDHLALAGPDRPDARGAERPAGGVRARPAGGYG
ncbi:phosphotransferase [Streptomyces sp. NPDC005209]|uniref:phosphotransferase n=1 Tax=Streptomyces sp. NPDC005209 TaxID=3156715 RepID=UPI0033A979F7